MFQQFRLPFLSKQLIWLSCFIFLGLWAMTPTTSPAPVSAAGGENLSAYLNADGTLNLPAGGIVGSINPAGYQLVSAAGEAPRFAPTAGSDDANWDPNFNLPGVDSFVDALAWDGETLYAGGRFETADGSPAGHVAYWTGVMWQPLGEGVSGNSVNALLWDGTYLYAGGDIFGDLSGLVRWDGTEWSEVGPGGITGQINALATDGSNIYVGGAFSTVSSTNNIARWDGTTWHAMNGGISGVVNTLVWSNSSLYAGGQFSVAGGNPANNIARWNGTNWNALEMGVDGIVHALAWDGSNLYVGGRFFMAGTLPTTHLARWDGTSWFAVGGGVNNDVYSLAWDNTENALYVGGDFWMVGSTLATHLAKWNGTSWETFENTPNGSVTALLPTGFGLAVAGNFTYINTGAPPYIRSPYITLWDGTNWQRMSHGAGVDETIYTLAWDGQYLYAGGSFSMDRWDGQKWEPLGSDFINGSVWALEWDGQYLYAGGNFAFAEIRGVARWDGHNWSAIGDGVDGTVYALESVNNNLYIGGFFSVINAPNQIREIARWDGTTWHSLGEGISGGGTVYALQWTGTNLYAGGNFYRAGGMEIKGIARWDGFNWSALGQGLSTTSGSILVSALAWDGQNLYVGGEFQNAGGLAVNNIARWDGANWHSMGSGTGGNNFPAVRSLLWVDPILYAGGHFTTMNGSPALGLAQWNGSTWSSLGTGIQYNLPGNTPYVTTLLFTEGEVYPSLFIGGDFDKVGNKPSSHIGRWRLAAVWDGGGADENGSTPENWSGDVMPTAADVLIFDSTSSKNAQLDSNFPTSVAGVVVDPGYFGTITQTQDFNITGQLVVEGGRYVMPNPAVAELTVENGVVHTGGVLSQSQAVNEAQVSFLEIKNSQNEVQYRGVELDTTTTQTNLGLTAVEVEAISGHSSDSCAFAPSALVYAQRCYTITPTTDEPAAVKLWALSTELNGISPYHLAVLRYLSDSSSWEELTNNSQTGENSAGYSYVQADTSGFSSFLMGQAAETITISVTVGLDEHSCATADNLILPLEGGEVTYCYTITNNSSLTLTNHTLTDEVFGSLLVSETYTLTPGASWFVTNTVMVTTTTENSALWTASDLATTLQYADTAVVTVADRLFLPVVFRR